MPDTSLTTFYAARRPANEHLGLGYFNLFDVADVLRYPPAPAVPSATFNRRS